MLPKHHPLGRIALAGAAALAFGLASPVAASPETDGKGRKMGHQQMCGPDGAHRAGRLSVTGQGESRIAPDIATVQLGVTTQAETAAEAMRQNATQQTAVIDALTGAGVAESDIQTSGLSLNPMVDYGEGRAPRVTGYQASNVVAVRVTEIDRLGVVLDAIVAAGANEINGISFAREDRKAAEDDARRAAVEDAAHKAGVLAEAAGLRLGPILTLRDGQLAEGPRPMARMAAEMGAAPDAVPVQPGELSMSTSVQIDYALLGSEADCERPRPGGDRPAPDDRAGRQAAPETPDAADAPAGTEAPEEPGAQSN
ncbi:SIMPL domain-containing protein [Paracoccus spongiarum]|uniref:SIMPL domain-containing protein n=1 Tax=Paracoccus spongiarum TaxID=3064387 RepID=A0ABT9JGT9_9RHOB|nr:SIMPL domain-containing protein [Paracoccus sp. 2205BS29-5]MDP5308266.1 SIMPL domain-containing protein [Paracoccus sp. 2205BS29-5]